MIFSKEDAMRIEKINVKGIEIAYVLSDKAVISDVKSALDLMMTVKYQTGLRNIAISKTLIDDKFFILSNRLAGEILQKFVNYDFRVAIYGDYTKYTSKPLKDFIYESNKGRDVFFTENLEKAAEKLTRAVL